MTNRKHVRRAGRAAAYALVAASIVSTFVFTAAAILMYPGSSHAAMMQKPTNTGPGSLAAARKFLEGRWSLMTFEVFPPGKPSIKVPGAGSATYDGFGNLQLEIRVDKATGSQLEQAGIPIVNGMLSIGGRTAVDMQRRTLTYFLEGQPPLGAPSNPLALNRPRYWEVEGNVLTLTTKGDDGQPLSVSRWQKLQ